MSVQEVERVPIAQACFCVRRCQHMSHTLSTRTPKGRKKEGEAWNKGIKEEKKKKTYDSACKKDKGTNGICPQHDNIRDETEKQRSETQKPFDNAVGTCEDGVFGGGCCGTDLLGGDELYGETDDYGAEDDLFTCIKS